MYENFNEYIEHDPDTVLVVNSSTKATFTNARRVHTSSLYYDFGEDYFGIHFIHKLDTTMTDCSVAPGFMYGITPSDSLTWVDYVTNNNTGVSLHMGKNTSRVYTLREAWSDVQDQSGSYTQGTTYYVTIERVGNYITAIIYTDAARTSIFDTLAIALPAGKTFKRINCPYCYGRASGDEEADWYVENLDLGEVCELPGDISVLTSNISNTPETFIKCRSYGNEVYMGTVSS